MIGTIRADGDQQSSSIWNKMSMAIGTCKLTMVTGLTLHLTPAPRTPRYSSKCARVCSTTVNRLHCLLRHHPRLELKLGVIWSHHRQQRQTWSPHFVRKFPISHLPLLGQRGRNGNGRGVTHRRRTRLCLLQRPRQLAKTGATAYSVFIGCIAWRAPSYNGCTAKPCVQLQPD